MVGSGIFATRLSPDDLGLQLLENSTATAGGLVALILAFGSVSGAHFNPIVSLADRIFGGLTTRELCAYVPAQVAGACAGAIVANLMFDLDPITLSEHSRDTAASSSARSSPSFGLLMVILGVVRSGRANMAPFAVAGYIARGLLVHVVDELRQPRRHRRADPERHLRRHRPVSAPGVHRRPARRGLLAVALARYLFPGLPALDLVVPHDHTEAAMKEPA